MTLVTIFTFFVTAGCRVVPKASAVADSSLRAGRQNQEFNPVKVFWNGTTAAMVDTSLDLERMRAKSEVVPIPSGSMQFLLIMPDRYNHIAYDVEYHGMMQQILTFPIRKPRTVNVAMATVKTWLADMVVQLTDIQGQPGKSIDWRRSITFAAFGFLYIGLVQWVLYVSVLTQFCPNAITFSNEPLEAKLLNIPGQIDLVKQVLIDNFIFEVLIYFPVFYVMKELIAGHSQQPVADGLKKYRTNIVSDNLTSMVFWIPGDCFAFAAPIFMRLPIDHTVSFLWTMVLSYRRGGAVPKRIEQP